MLWLDGLHIDDGMLLCRWTNGLFKSTLHRVINTTGQERYSIAFFFEPNFTAKVECLPCCVSEERPAAYPPTTAGEHLLAMYAQTHAGYDVNKKGQGAAATVAQQA
jgi:isopenicillin N synthase-like dioxygenase